MQVMWPCTKPPILLELGIRYSFWMRTFTIVRTYFACTLSPAHLLGSLGYILYVNLTSGRIHVRTVNASYAIDNWKTAKVSLACDTDTESVQLRFSVSPKTKHGIFSAIASSCREHGMLIHQGASLMIAPPFI
jgi:hypothetical protein